MYKNLELINFKLQSSFTMAMNCWGKRFPLSFKFEILVCFFLKNIENLIKVAWHDGFGVVGNGGEGYMRRPLLAPP